SNQMAAIVDRKFKSMQKTKQNPDGEILQFARRSGRAENDEENDPVNVTEYILTINPKAGRSRQEILKQLLDETKDELPPGVDVEDEQPLQHLIGHMLTGVKAQ